MQQVMKFYEYPSYHIQKKITSVSNMYISHYNTTLFLRNAKKHGNKYNNHIV